VRAAIAAAAAPVRRFLFGMCGDWDEAADLAQGALLKAWEKRDRFDGRCAVRTWVFTIARNHWRDRLRRKRSAPRSETMDEGKFVRDRSARDPVAHRELTEAVQRALETLPEPQREVLALRESEGLTFVQVAELLAIPVSTAKSRTRYALLKLADELKDFRSELES